MADLSKRVDELSPDKRKLLEQLLKSKQSTHQSQAPRPAFKPPAAFGQPPGQAVGGELNAAAAPTDGDLLTLEYGSSAAETKANYRRFYNQVSQQLDSNTFGQFSYFLNYGYVPDSSPTFSVVELPDYFMNKNSVRLVLELIGDCDLKDRRVLDVGCGRGGAVQVINQFFAARSITGLDLSPNAIAFCKTRHRYDGVSFYEGDAENLPFADGAFDVVTNIESSHSYPNLHQFYSEVYRVLAADGYFLYTDLLSGEQIKEELIFLRRLGFSVERDHDITANVLLSCDEIASTRAQAYDTRNDSQLMENFLATPGSQVYEQMRHGVWSYRICKLHKNL